MWHLRGVVLPTEEERDIYIDGDGISFTPVPGAETILDGGFVLPGLVDSHCHPGTSEIGGPLDEVTLREHGQQYRDRGISALRVPGAAGRLPAWFGHDADLPRVWSAGLAVAARGGLFPGWGRQLEPEAIPAAAAEESIHADGWCKLIVDWMTDDGGYEPTIPADIVTAATARVHEAGGRVAVHSQHTDGGTAAVRGGVDSIEHGMHLSESLLDVMAAQGAVLVPTIVTFAHIAPQMSHPDVPPDLQEWFRHGWERHPGLVRAAYEAGVTVLAGTDLPPGHLNEEIRWLAEAGLPAEVALGAATWSARQFLGLPNIEEGAVGDLIAFDTDPRHNLAVLDQPARVLVRGCLIR